MKEISKLRKKFIKLCNEKMKSKNISPKDISKKMNLEAKSIKKFFENENNAKLDTIIKILSSMNLELNIKGVK